MRFLCILAFVFFASNVDADVAVQAKDTATDLEQELQTYLNTHHPYDEINERFNVINFFTGQVASFIVVQTNPYEPYRSVTPTSVSQAMKERAAALQKIYASMQKEGDVVIPAQVVPGAYELSTTGAYQSWLDDYLRESEVLLGVNEQITGFVTTIETSFGSIREVAVERTVILADGGKADIKIVKTQYGAKYVLIAIRDKLGNHFPLTGVITPGAITFLVLGNDDAYQDLRSLLVRNGFIMVPRQDEGEGTVEILRIECDSQGHCKIVEN